LYISKNCKDHCHIFENIEFYHPCKLFLWIYKRGLRYNPGGENATEESRKNELIAINDV